MTTEKLDKLRADEVVRYRDGLRYFGLRPSQLRLKIKEGLIPAPLQLSESGRALGWLGKQIHDYQSKLTIAPQFRKK